MGTFTPETGDIVTPNAIAKTLGTFILMYSNSRCLEKDRIGYFYSHGLGLVIQSGRSAQDELYISSIEILYDSITGWVPLVFVKQAF